MTRYILCLALGLCSFLAKGQNIKSDTITWTSDQAVNQTDSSAMAYNCSFTTSAAEVDWIQRNGTKVSTFTVNSIDGTWSDISQDGQVSFQVSSGNISGSFTFSRVQGNLSIHMQLFVSDQLDQDYVFRISAFNLSN